MRCRQRRTSRHMIWTFRASVTCTAGRARRMRVGCVRRWIVRDTILLLWRYQSSSGQPAPEVRRDHLPERWRDRAEHGERDREERCDPATIQEDSRIPELRYAGRIG